MASLRSLLESEDLVVAPGAYDPITARLLRHLGFRALYVGSDEAGLTLGRPPGTLTFGDLATIGERVSESVQDELPVIVDCGAGFMPLAVLWEAVRVLEAAGVAAMHFDDRSDSMHSMEQPSDPSLHRERFRDRLAVAGRARRGRDLMIVALVDRGRDRVDRIDASLDAADQALAAKADGLMVAGDFPLDGFARLRAFAPGLPIFVSAGLRAHSVPELREAGGRVVVCPSTTLQAAVRALQGPFRQLAETGYLPPVDPTRAKFIRALGEELQDLEQKIAIELETTEAGRTPPGTHY